MAEEISNLLTTGLLALLGTVAGGVVKGYWDTRLADKDFQSRFLLRALEPNDIEFGISPTSNAMDDMIQKNPTLKDKELALVALKVRHGDVIDAITPIYAEITPDLRLGETVVGKQYGGIGGGETVLEQKGFVVVGVNLYQGDYFGQEEVVQIELIWHRLTQQGIDPATEVVSETLGSGNYADLVRPAQLRANPGYYISNFFASTSSHTSGETFLHDFDIEQKRLPLAD